MNENLLNRLRELLGAHHVLSEGDLNAWQQDWRKRYHGKALAVVQPGNTQEVAQVVQACAHAGASIVPQGGNTSLCGGSVPDVSGKQIVLSLSRLNKIRDIDAINLSMTVEAGCVLQAVQAAAADQNLLFPLSLAAQGQCQIGGNLATNAGGTQVLRYGNMRELCLGLEVVTPNGDIWQGLQSLRKDNSGYALRDLMIGSEGTLGVITAASLKLFPMPTARISAWVSCASLEHCLSLLQKARAQLGAGLTAFEAMNEFSLQLVAKHFVDLPRPLPSAAWTVLIELSDALDDASANSRMQQLLFAAQSGGDIIDASIASNYAQAQVFWQTRECIPLAQSSEGLNIKHDIALPISAIAPFVRQMDATLSASFAGIRIVNFGHLGDGNLHYNVQAPEAMAAAEFLSTHEAAVQTLVFDVVASFGGTFSAEHGIGQLKREALAQRKDAVALAMMRQIKQALDPHNIMNPGRVL